MLRFRTNNSEVLRLTANGRAEIGGAPIPALFATGIPTFGMCYGFQAMAQALGGTVEKTGLAEYGSTPATISDTSSTLFAVPPTCRGC